MKWQQNVYSRKQKSKTGWKHNECVRIKEIHRPKSWNNNEQFYIGFFKKKGEKKNSKHKKTLEQLKTKKK